MSIFNEIKSMFNPSSGIDLREEIKVITTGPLGKQTKNERYELWNQDDVNIEYQYIGENLKIIFTQKGFASKYDTFKQGFYIYYEGELVYPQGSKKPSVWLDNFKEAYQKTLIEIERIKESRKQKKLQEEKNSNFQQKIQYLFKRTYPDIYYDDKIIIEHYKPSKYTYYSTEDGDITLTTYQGKITLITGEVVYDSKEDIHHQGLWEIYVSELSDQLDLQEKLKNEENRRKYQLKKQMHEKEKQKRYENNHTMINDSDLFGNY